MKENKTIDEVLRRLSVEEIKTLTPLSDEIITAALRRGREEADKWRDYLNAVGPLSEISYR